MFTKTVFVYFILWLHNGNAIGQFSSRSPRQLSPAFRRLLNHFVSSTKPQPNIVNFLIALDAHSALSAISHEDIMPIDQIIEQAEESAAFRRSEPYFMQEENAIKLEGDIMMSVEQFTDMQTNITFDMFEDAIARILNTNGHSQAMNSLMNVITSSGHRGRHLLRRGKRAARRDTNRLWPNAVMPILIASSDFSDTHKRNIGRAMRRISESTCICFRIINNQIANTGIPHVRIVDGSGCSSYVGVTTLSRGSQNSQDLTLSSRCRSTRIATHEILHALGLYHEQSRPDRDAYVRIIRENIRSGSEGNFNRYSRQTVDSRGLPYDYLSIMHYSSRAFSKDGSNTIEPIPAINRDQFLNIIGRATTMSEGDVEVLRQMYNCPSFSMQPRCQDYPYTFL